MNGKVIFYTLLVLVFSCGSDSARGLAFEEHVISDTLQAIQDISVVDLDNDDDFDIISTDMDGRDSGRIIWWENTNDGEFVSHTISEDLPYSRGCRAVDIDGDEDIDLIVAGGMDFWRRGERIGNVYLFENDGEQQFEMHIITDDFFGAYDLSSGDIDDDGDLDILVSARANNPFGVYFGGISWFENQGDRNFTEHIITQRAPHEDWDRGKNIAPLKDLDDDGDLDLVVCGVFTHVLEWWENDGNGSFENHHLGEIVCNVIITIDFDLDRDCDLIIGYSSARREGEYTHWFENDGEQNFNHHAIRTGLLRNRSLTVADIDRDQDYDLVFSGFRDNEEEQDFYILENDGEMNFELVSISDEPIRPRESEAVDINNDGDLDLILRAENGKLSWWQQLAEATLHLNRGWNLYSSHINPVNNSILDLFSVLVDRETLALVKDFRGRFYTPLHNFNNIPFWDYSQGYLIKVTEDDSLLIEGEIIPSDVPIPLDEGWNMVAYFPEELVEVSDAFVNIEDVLLIVKDGEGHFYIPEREFNNMQPLRRGLGYMVKITEEFDLIWNVP